MMSPNQSGFVRDLGAWILFFGWLGVASPPVSSETLQNFDCDPEVDSVGCTRFIPRAHQQPPSPQVLDGGPTGRFLRLAATGGAVPNVNTIDFVTTDGGPHCGMSVEFDFRITPGAGALGGRADGLGLALLNTGVYGDDRFVAPMHPLFVPEEPSFITSLGVGFDIFQNPESLDDGNNHVSLHWDGRLLGQFESPVDMASGEFVHARVTVETDSNPPVVSVEIAPRGGSASPVVDRFPIPDLFPYESRVHFGARSGGYTADHDLDNVRATFESCPEESGALVVELRTEPYGVQDEFTMTGDAAGVLRDGQWLTVPVAPGTYTVTEQVPEGWSLDSIACGDGDSTADIKTATATFRIAPGETAICRFHNSTREVPDVCAAQLTLTCDAPFDQRRNDAPRSTRTLNRFTCLELGYRSPELIYSLVPPIDGRYSVRLSDLGADLDLIVLGPDVCQADACVAASDASINGDEELTFEARADETFFIVVDGVDGAISGYTLELTCPEVPSADFIQVPAFPIAEEPIAFFDTSQGEPSAWNWSFGDGPTATVRNPSHTYSSPGTFDVTLTVENGFGQSTEKRPIVVARAEASVRIEGPTSGQAGVPVRLTAIGEDCQPEDRGWSWLTAGGEALGTADGETVEVVWDTAGEKTVSALNLACGTAVGTLTLSLAPPAPAMNLPAAPSNLSAEPRSSTDVVLRWSDTSAEEQAFRIERRRGEGPFEPLALVPANTEALEVSVADSPNPTRIPNTFRVFALNSVGASASSNEASTTTKAESCDSTVFLCLLDKRFAIEMVWQVDGNLGRGVPASLTSDTGYFWFFSPDNVEVVVKVIDGRAVTGYFWVFFGALTDVNFILRVTDTETGDLRIYSNPEGQFASVGDTMALPGDRGAGSGAGSAALPRWAASGPLPKVDEVDFTWVPDTPRTGEVVLFRDRSGVSTPRLDRIWDFGDGSEPITSSEETIDHRFASPGSFDVTLELVDRAGDVGILNPAVSRRVQITPPEEARLTLTTQQSVVLARTATLNAKANKECSPLRPSGWQWDVGDGTVVGAADSASIDAFWTTLGPRTITVRNSGCSEATASTVVEVIDDPNMPRGCESSPTVLCLFDNRFQVEVVWRDFRGNSGSARAKRLTRESGQFYFFSPENVELVLKILDGREINGYFWVFYGALSNVEFKITVTDKETGMSREFFNPLGEFASIGDTSAFPGD